ncbi:MAG: FHA domain-containing protein [Bacteroidales bacterium]|nr:FHA domain-containing protein [Bacteroidales bacterium]
MKKLISIGRNPNNTIVINDGIVSGNHCQIVLEDNNVYTIIDLNSTNGTYVNGVRISGSAILNSTDKVKLSNMVDVNWISYFSEYTNSSTSYSFNNAYNPYTNSSFNNDKTKKKSRTLIYALSGVGVAALLIVGIVLFFCFKEDSLDIENAKYVPNDAVLVANVDFKELSNINDKSLQENINELINTINKINYAGIDKLSYQITKIIYDLENDYKSTGVNLEVTPYMFTTLNSMQNYTTSSLVFSIEKDKFISNFRNVYKELRGNALEYYKSSKDIEFYLLDSSSLIGVKDDVAMITVIVGKDRDLDIVKEHIIDCLTLSENKSFMGMNVFEKFNESEAFVNLCFSVPTKLGDVKKFENIAGVQLRNTYFISHIEFEENSVKWNNEILYNKSLKDIDINNILKSYY